MEVILIAAVAANGGIGNKGDLLWYIKEDLKHFKALTKGNSVIMGRHTWESLPNRPLPGRLNIVISRNPGYEAEGAKVAKDIDTALRIAGENNEEKAFIIGGGELYRATIGLADTLELTEIAAVPSECDTFFPTYKNEEWQEVSRQKSEAGAQPVYDFVRYERKK